MHILTFHTAHKISIAHGDQQSQAVAKLYSSVNCVTESSVTTEPYYVVYLRYYMYSILPVALTGRENSQTIIFSSKKI
jgi:hypothetical protein